MRPIPTLPNPNVDIAHPVDDWWWTWRAMVIGPILIVLVLAPIAAWGIHLLGPLFQVLGSLYLGLWPAEFR